MFVVDAVQCSTPVQVSNLPFPDFRSLPQRTFVYFEYSTWYCRYCTIEPDTSLPWYR
jgi:hypothetical protein